MCQCASRTAHYSLINTGKSVINGGELEMRGRFGGLQVDAGAAYVNSSLGAITLVNTEALPPGTTAQNLPQCAPACDRESRGLARHRNDFEISMLPQVKEREPDPPRNSGDAQRARYCSAQPEEVRHSTPTHTSASALFTSPSP